MVHVTRREGRTQLTTILLKNYDIYETPKNIIQIERKVKVLAAPKRHPTSALRNLWRNFN